MPKPRTIQSLKRKGLADDLKHLHLSWIMTKAGFNDPDAVFSIDTALEKLFDNDLLEQIHKIQGNSLLFFNEYFKTEEDFHRVIDWMIKEEMIVELEPELNLMAGTPRRFKVAKRFHLSGISDFIKMLAERGFFAVDKIKSKQVALILVSSFDEDRMHSETTDRKAKAKFKEFNILPTNP
jgi:hypothetical protein